MPSGFEARLAPVGWLAKVVAERSVLYDGSVVSGIATRLCAPWRLSAAPIESALGEPLALCQTIKVSWAGHLPSHKPAQRPVSPSSMSGKSFGTRQIRTLHAIVGEVCSRWEGFFLSPSVLSGTVI
jgi:hypothetical protein